MYGSYLQQTQVAPRCSRSLSGHGDIFASPMIQHRPCTLLYNNCIPLSGADEPDIVDGQCSSLQRVKNITQTDIIVATTQQTCHLFCHGMEDNEGSTQVAASAPTIYRGYVCRGKDVMVAHINNSIRFADRFVRTCSIGLSKGVSMNKAMFIVPIEKLACRHRGMGSQYSNR